MKKQLTDDFDFDDIIPKQKTKENILFKMMQNKKTIISSIIAILLFSIIGLYNTILFLITLISN